MSEKETKYLVDDIYDILEDEIVSLKIKPGELLSENSLCKRFDVSRTPIRSVLQRLEHARFVDIVPHKGTIVTTIDLNIVNQVIYGRIALENKVFKDFLNVCTYSDIEKCRYHYERLKSIAKSFENKSEDEININEFLKADLNMHKVWYDVTAKQFLWEVITKPQADYSRFIRLDIVGARNVPDVVSEHKKFIEIMDKKDTAEVEELLSRHLFGGVRRLGSELFSDKYKYFFKGEH